MSMYTLIETEPFFEGKLQIAYLNQPETFNSLNEILMKELLQFITECEADNSVRCIAISGRGKAFCSGQNLKEILSSGELAKERVIERVILDVYNPLVEKIIHCKKPIISLVNGPAVGAGAMLALICDFTLATESAYFSQAFINIGLIPDTAGTYYLPRLLGRQTANYLAFTGKKISSEEAKQLGIIADYFSDNQFVEKSIEVLDQISNAPTQALGLMKKAFNLSYENTLKEQLILESVLQQEAAETEDFKEGVTAFLEKRQPKYKGQ